MLTKVMALELGPHKVTTYIYIFKYTCTPATFIIATGQSLNTKSTRSFLAHGPLPFKMTSFKYPSRSGRGQSVIKLSFELGTQVLKWKNIKKKSPTSKRFLLKPIKF